MAMPLDLVLVRHGESEGNVALHRSKRGDDSLLDNPDFVGRHSSQWRLTQLGVEQAKTAGAWIKANIGERFGRYYTSEYHRAMETAGLLDLPDAEWMIQPALHERSWGELDRLSEAERSERFAQSLADKKTTPFYWTPPNGESIAQVCIRIRTVLDTLHRECSDKQVILVCHGEVMEAFRATLERMPQHDFMAWTSSKDPIERIHNCQVIHYTRKDPESGEITERLNWRRSTYTWDESKSDPNWRRIERARYSNEQLLRFASSAPRIVEG